MAADQPLTDEQAAVIDAVTVRHRNGPPLNKWDLLALAWLTRAVGLTGPDTPEPQGALNA